MLKIRTSGVHVYPLPSYTRQQPFYPLPGCGVERHGFIIQPSHSFGFLAAQMTLTDFNAHNLAAASYMETGLGPFMSLYLGHLQPLPFSLS